MREEKSGIDEGDPAAAGSGSGSRFHMLQPNRDLEVNWTVDLAKNLEEYLLKICSGEIDADGEEMGHLSVNFAEAAMLLQGSIQVYSRKVEYLYTLVLHAMEFLSREKHDHTGNFSPQPDGTEDHSAITEEDGTFIGLDDINVEAKNCLDDEDNESDCLNPLVKPPANLVVVEGDCLENICESTKLDSYLLSACNFYGDFLLLDPCDAEAVYNFKREKTKVKDRSAARRSSVLRMNTQSSPHSPFVEKSAGKGQKSAGTKQNASFDNNLSSPSCGIDPDNPSSCRGGPEFGYPDINDDDDDDNDDDDPWKPLNPHEAGNLRIKPFKRCSVFKRKIVSFNKRAPTSLEFPEAKVEGTIDPELAEIFTEQIHARVKSHSSQSPPLFEKLRQSLVSGKYEAHDLMDDLDDENNDADGDSDVMDDVNLTEDSINVDAEVSLHNEKQNGDVAQFNVGDDLGRNDVYTEQNLEDLCRSHLDSLLASIVEAEKQTEIAARVSTWKQKIEHTLEEEDSLAPFDIHHYGEKIMSKLLEETVEERSMCFTDIVAGQPKHDVARSFSALLQLVNDGTVELDRGSSSQPMCFTSANPFIIKLNSPEIREGDKILHFKKRVNSPLGKKSLKIVGFEKSTLKSDEKGDDIRWSTPDGKKRRRSKIR